MLKGYRDDFPLTAPVGSFAANSLGLFDLGGNASEWCEDRFNATSEERVVRGGGFTMGDKMPMQSDYRQHDIPERHASGIGFRVVLASAP